MRCRAVLLLAVSFVAVGVCSPTQVVLSPDGTKAVRVDIVEPEIDLGRPILSIAQYDPVTRTWGLAVPLVTEGYNASPSWSPDSTRIAFDSYRLVPGTATEFERAIFVINADGSGEVNLTRHFPSTNIRPLWSPDGAQIAFLSDRGREYPDIALWVMASDGSSPVEVADSVTLHPEWPRWADDDTLIFYLGGKQYLAFADGSAPPVPVTSPPRPYIESSSIVLASLAPQQSVLSPLALASVFGFNIATGRSESSVLGEDGKLATDVLGSCVKVGGADAAILAVTPGQINFQIPAETPVGPNQVTVIKNCNTDQAEFSPPVTAFFERASPGFFRYFNMNVAARFQDGVAVAPGGFFSLIGTSRLAKPGDIISIYGTGWGPTTASIGTGELVPEVAPLLPEANPTVTFGGLPLPAENILYIGAAPGAAGLYQLNMIVPSTPGVGERGIKLTIYGQSTPDGPVVAVE